MKQPPHVKKLVRTHEVCTGHAQHVVQYFKDMAAEAGVPYQSLINLYLRDCLAQNRKVEIKWPSAV